MRVEIDGTDEAGYFLTVTQPDGLERTETFQSSAAAHERWLELQQRFQKDGWWGPSGRD